MYPPLGPNLRARVLARMHAHPAADTTVELPEWYFRHWHFGPGGYLTGVGIRWYDWVVRRAYYQLHEGGAHAAVLNALGEAGCRKVVEVGCGSGRLLRSLVASRQFDAVTGLEISPLLVDRARRAAPGVSVRQSDGTLDAVAEAEADAVVMAHVVGHVPPAVAGTLLAQALRLAGDRGRVALVEHAWHPLDLGRARIRRDERFHAGMQRLIVLSN